MSLYNSHKPEGEQSSSLELWTRPLPDVSHPKAAYLHHSVLLAQSQIDFKVKMCLKGDK